MLLPSIKPRCNSSWSEMVSERSLAEKRQFQRFFYDAKAVLVGDEATLPCRITDLCLKGCMLEFGQPWVGPVERLYTLILSLSDEVVISMKLRFAHGQGKQIGFKCDQIDLDSMTNLRRLVELNLGDSELLERELNSLADSESFEP